MKIKTLEVPSDVEVDYSRMGRVTLIPHSQKAIDRINKMSDVEKYQFAVSYLVRTYEPNHGATQMVPFFEP